ncbi:PorP/SprF family type IX secretion system membrane protein [Lewinella sp. 4G2]|uniref:PorP/SprF family type IX secretion system membrane protein n=1 Tax=Lewinella sp. 4G2 TaxID=1803372 RepID=UPI0007B4EB5F|nr:PorP/SprF family type IX secretion system membrane protein [Lewinella sp. 4G2]OAV45433.1 hypothetical protein A3850_013440 [Lewinella sp. 4G2]
MQLSSKFFKLAFCFGLLLSSCWALAQDARFANLGATPQLTNPALTGVISGQLRATANYRELYTALPGAEGYRSYAAGVELRRPAGNGNYFGLGAQLQRDNAPSSDFNRTQGFIGGSYQQQIGGNLRRGLGQYLSAGAQVGFGQRGFDLNKVWFSNQYFVDNNSREAYIDRTLPSGEGIAGVGNGTYLDVNVGLSYFGTFGDRLAAYAGVGAYHLNAPNVSPLPAGRDDLDQRYVFHGGGELPLGNGYPSLLPAARVMVQGPSLDVLLGSHVRYTQRDWREVALRAGLWLQGSNQSGDNLKLNAIIVSFGLETERVQFAVNYDISVGDLNTITNSRGGWELSAIYQQPADYRGKVVCPKF